MSRSLKERLREQAEHCRRAGSDLTGALLDGAAGELDQPGPVRDLLGPLACDPGGSVPALRFAAAMHRLVLERRAPELALHYPSVGGSAPPQDVWRVARRTVADHLDALTGLVRRPVQTNEVGRSAALLGGLAFATAQTGLPVRLLELGASAGLNLRVEEFAYEVGDRVLGDPASPVRLVQPWEGSRPPDVPVRVVERRGCDPAPLDPGSAADRLTLTSCVWGDQVARLERLRGALEVAQRVPAAVASLPASAFLARELAAPVEGVLTVVWHSVVWQYMAPAERETTTRLLAQAGDRGTPAAPLARLSLEPERDRNGGSPFRVRLSSWPGPQRRLLAEAQGHGPPVVWR